MPDNIRNWAALSPYMNKGGAHEKEPSRRQDKRQLAEQDVMEEYHQYLQDIGELDSSPSFLFF